MRRPSTKALGNSRHPQSSVWRAGEPAAALGWSDRMSQWRRVDQASTAKRFSPSTLNMNDSPARIDPAEDAIDRRTSTARRLVEASVSPNTRRAYAGALRRLDAWLAGRELHDATLAAYLAELHDAGRASASASMAVAAACFRAKLAGQSIPVGERTARVLAGYRRTAGDSRPRAGAAVRPVGPGRRARHLSPAAAARARRRVRPGRGRAWKGRRCGRGAAVHGGDAA